jgi:hypothetical protein
MKICERDETPCKRMVLCVSSIKAGDSNKEPQVMWHKNGSVMSVYYWHEIYFYQWKKELKMVSYTEYKKS